MAASYSAKDIEVLEGLEPVRQRPGMYIGSTETSEGLHHLVYEILDNAVDEAMNGYANKISVTLHKDQESVTVTDNGRGIPVDNHPKFKKPALEIILTTLHAGGKFSDKNYRTAGGLHGVGSSVVNALSEELIATVRRDGKEYSQRYSQGVAKTKLIVGSKGVKGTGTSIFFRPDAAIFKKRQFSSKIIEETLRTKAYLNPGLSLTFVDETSKTTTEYCYQDGIVAYLKELLEERKLEALGAQHLFLETNEKASVSIALAWTDTPKEEFISFANGIRTRDGGSHEMGAKSGIVKAVRNYLNVHNINLKGVKLGSEDIREGLICLVTVKLPGDEMQAQFQGQTKDRLNNPEVAPIVENAARGLEKLLNENPSLADLVVQRITMAAKARAASRQAGQSVRRKIGVSHRLTLPGKLADCSSSKSGETELFIVEGDSAGGSTKQGRDRNCQAVLPLRGKVLNTVAANTKKVLDNKELANIISALGCGVGTSFDVSKLRYGKVIILTDADADGMHIATLLMAFFFQYMRPLIQEGALYIGKPPLYGIFPKGGIKKAAAIKKAATKVAAVKSRRKNNAQENALWAYGDAELDQIIAKNKLVTPRIVRYKGLGEMNPETLWETTLDPDARTLLRVTMAEEKYVEEALEALMGGDPQTRYQLIQDHAEEITVDV